MFYFDKRIRYLFYYENDIKLQNVGYAMFQVRDHKCSVYIYIRGPRIMGSGQGRIYLEYLKHPEGQQISDANSVQYERTLLGNLMIKNGQATYHMWADSRNMGEKEVRYDEVVGIYIELSDERTFRSRWIVEHKMEDERECEEIDSLNDECVKIEKEQLKEIVSEGEELCYNSFLLHGYYNYRYLILRRKECENGEEYYIGVPGIYHVREKAVALMFGFPYFESTSGNVSSGEFGYYFRKVDLRS